MNNILIIEDDSEVCEVLRFYLTQSDQYRADIVHCAEAALSLVKDSDYDAILLDIMLPSIDGITFCAQLRNWIYCPIIFISCLGDDETIVRAMQMGGDDYLVKPFSCSMLLAYLEANIRRSRMSWSTKESIHFDDLELDPAVRRLRKNGVEVALSPTEYNILHYMMCHPDEFIAFADMYENVWNTPSCGDVRTLFTHVGNLRKKIEDDPHMPKYIVTHQRGGYIFVSESDANHK